MKTWPLYDDYLYAKAIGILLLIWLIVGCDRPGKAQPTGTPQPVSVTPVATATLQSQECPWGQRITGCDG